MREAISLWQETLDALAEHGKSWNDILGIGIGRDKRMLKGEFERNAKEIVYRPWMYGGHMIVLDLQLYGNDFILVRHEYDGSECWWFYDTTLNSDARFVKGINELKEGRYRK